MRRGPWRVAVAGHSMEPALREGDWLLVLPPRRQPRVGEVVVLRDPRDAFDVFTRSANRLDDWYAGGRRGSRPAGRLRHHHAMPPPAATARWAEPSPAGMT